MHAEYPEAEAWLRKAVRHAPHPLPRGMFPAIVEQGEKAGFSRSLLNDVVDEWLNFGYCRITDPITNDIELLPAGEAVFGRTASLAPDQEGTR